MKVHIDVVEDSLRRREAPIADLESRLPAETASPAGAPASPARSDGPRLLIVALANSVHTANYLKLLDGTGWQVEVFDAQFGALPHPDTPAMTIHTGRAHESRPGDAFTSVPPESGDTTGIDERAAQLADLIREFEPELVHSHEIQHSGALVDLARARLGGLPCPWLQTSWGSDIYMYSRHPNYVDRIRSVMSGIDYFNAECHRDVAIARAMGFSGRAVGVWPVVGGFDVGHVQNLAVPGKVSARRSIAVKGALGSLARGEVALEALDLAGRALKGFEVCTYQTSPSLEDGFRRTVERHGGTYRLLSRSEADSVPHDEILALHGRSRVSLA